MSFGNIISGLVTAFLTFTVTNIDDFGILLIYFARAKSNQNMTKPPENRLIRLKNDLFV